MAARSGQRGCLEKKNGYWRVRFRIDVPGQENREQLIGHNFSTFQSLSPSFWFHQEKVTRSNLSAQKTHLAKSRVQRDFWLE